mmetsp:Transcript_27664/g.54014  ORF Transcript_27664/g.54014 Transcript_27664/m.54014 type:complete len:477 (-) Transcript_27664:648-2078(-)
MMPEHDSITSTQSSPDSRPEPLAEASSAGPTIGGAEARRQSRSRVSALASTKSPELEDSFFDCRRHSAALTMTWRSSRKGKGFELPPLPTMPEEVDIDILFNIARQEGRRLNDVVLSRFGSWANWQRASSQRSRNGSFTASESAASSRSTTTHLRSSSSPGGSPFASILRQSTSTRRNEDAEETATALHVSWDLPDGQCESSAEQTRRDVPEGCNPFESVGPLGPRSDSARAVRPDAPIQVLRRPSTGGGLSTLRRATRTLRGLRGLFGGSLKAAGTAPARLLRQSSVGEPRTARATGCEATQAAEPKESRETENKESSETESKESKEAESMGGKAAEKREGKASRIKRWILHHVPSINRQPAAVTNGSLEGGGTAGESICAEAPIVSSSSVAQSSSRAGRGRTAVTAPPANKAPSSAPSEGPSLPLFPRPSSAHRQRLAAVNVRSGSETGALTSLIMGMAISRAGSVGLGGDGEL